MIECEEIGNRIDRRDGDAPSERLPEQIGLGRRDKEAGGRCEDLIGRMRDRLAGEQTIGVGAPILVRPRGVDRARIDHPFHHERQHRPARDDDHVAVLADEDARQRHHTQLEHRAHPRVVLVDRGGAHAVHHRPGHGGLRRDVDTLGQAGPEHACMTDERRGRGLGARMAPHLRDRHTYGRPISSTLKRHRPCERGDAEIRGGPIGIRTVASERRDGHGDQSRICGRERLEVETVRFEHARRG